MVTLLSFDPDHLAPNPEPDAAFDQGSGRHQRRRYVNGTLQVLMPAKECGVKKVVYASSS